MLAQQQLQAEVRHALTPHASSDHRLPNVQQQGPCSVQGASKLDLTSLCPPPGQLLGAAAACPQEVAANAQQ